MALLSLGSLLVLVRCGELLSIHKVDPGGVFRAERTHNKYRLSALLLVKQGSSRQSYDACHVCVCVQRGRLGRAADIVEVSAALFMYDLYFLQCST